MPAILDMADTHGTLTSSREVLLGRLTCQILKFTVHVASMSLSREDVGLRVEEKDTSSQWSSQYSGGAYTPGSRADSSWSPHH